MSPKELFELLDKNDIDHELVEIFEGVRILAIQVEEEEDGSMMGVDDADKE